MLKIAISFVAYVYFGDEFLTKFAILLGSAPEDFRQKKIEDMFDFLDSKRSKGDSIVTFANGISEMMLEMVMDNSVKQLTNAVVSSASTTTQSEHHSATQSCHSEFISESTKEMLKQVQHDGHFERFAPTHALATSDVSESTNARHSEAKPKNLFLQEMFRSAQHDVLLLYICTLQPLSDNDKSFWLGGEEIRRDVILHYQELAAEYGIDMQVVFDFDRELVKEEELGWEKVENV